MRNFQASIRAAMHSRINEANLSAYVCVLSEILAEVKRIHLTREKNISVTLSYQKVGEKAFEGFTWMK